MAEELLGDGGLAPLTFCLVPYRLQGLCLERVVEKIVAPNERQLRCVWWWRLVLVLGQSPLSVCCTSIFAVIGVEWL